MQAGGRGGDEQRHVVAAAVCRLADLPVTPPPRALGKRVGGAGTGSALP